MATTSSSASNFCGWRLRDKEFDVSLCPKCGKNNQPHYKFCLGCGAELTGKDTNGPAPVVRSQPAAKPDMPTMMAEPDPARAATPRVGTSPPVFSDMGPPQDPTTDPAIPAMLDQPIAADAPLASSHGAKLCMTCGTVVAPGFKFCPACGGTMEGAAPVAKGATGARQAVVPSATPAVAGKLVLIRPDGSEGGTHALVAGENALGRSVGGLFEADGYLSPVHAELVMNAAGAVLRDASSLNGVFVKITHEEELFDGDIFRIGQELMRFDAIPGAEPLEDGTEVLGSPNPGFWGRLAVVVGKDQDGSAFPLLGDAILLGRERGDILFPEDGYVSGSHARLAIRDGRFWLSDLNSSNGTFLRVRGERPVENGSYILMGQQLFKLVY
jgi:hypothetical protein